MGDRCSLTIHFRQRDEERVKDILGEDFPDATDDGSVQIEVEANYGWYSDREALARAGVPFYGDHGDGGDYMAAEFASTGDGRSYDTEAPHGAIMVEVDSTGEVVPARLAEAREVIWAQRRAVLIVHGHLLADNERPCPDCPGHAETALAAEVVLNSAGYCSTGSCGGEGIWREAGGSDLRRCNLCYFTAPLSVQNGRCARCGCEELEKP